MDDIKKFKRELSKMSESDYLTFQKREAKKPTSNFMKFVQKVSGREFFRKGKKIYKWELYSTGCNAENYQKMCKYLGINIV